MIVLPKPGDQPGLENNRYVFWILWSDDPNDLPKVHHWINGVLRVACALFLANAVAEHHLRQLVESSKDENEVEAAEHLLTSMYVHYEIGADDKFSKAIIMEAKISKMFKDMGMKATKYASNSSEVLATIPKEIFASPALKELPSTPRWT